MSSLSHVLNHSPGVRPHVALRHCLKGVPVSEAFWFTLSLALFLALGPFSALPALFAVFSLAGKDGDGEQPEAAA